MHDGAYGFQNTQPYRSVEDLSLDLPGEPHVRGAGCVYQVPQQGIDGVGTCGGCHVGSPYPELTDGIGLHKLPNLDLYNSEHLFRPASYGDLLKSPINQLELIGVSSGGFPEPFTFGMRAYNYFRRKRPNYDIVHDNQCLSYGILGLPRLGFPTVATIHHPITVDRDVEIKSTRSLIQRFKTWRWYSFLGMQKRVSRHLSHIITVSECSKRDISRDFRTSSRRFRVVPNGINTDFFYPLPHVQRSDDQILVTNSADTPLKGLRYLLEAVASIRKRRKIGLTVIGTPKKNGVIEGLVRKLRIRDCVTFTGRIEYEEFASYYARATMAVIPSLYEGFGMPAGEAMACGVPVISTVGGALPEVVGDAGVLVPTADSKALEEAIISLLDDPDRRQRLGEAGLKRVKGAFTWKHAAQKTVDVYREVIDAYC